MKWVRIAAVLFAPLVSAPAWSQEITRVGPGGTFTIGPSVGTLGLGLEAGYRPNDYLAFRLGGNMFNYDFDTEIDDIDYDADLKLKSAGLIADIHPFGGAFRISFGARLNLNEASLSATPTDDLEIGGVTYTPAEVGTLSGEIEFNKFAPYVGFGYEGAPFPTDAFVLGIEAGVMYHGAPKVNLKARNSVVDADDLERERRDIEDDIEKFKFYPVVMLMAKLRF